MPIFDIRQVNLKRANDDEEQLGRRLCMASMDHAVQVLGQTGLNLSYSSCNAAVAIDPHYGYQSLIYLGLTFAPFFGSSRLFTGLDPDYNRVQNISPNRQFAKSQREEHAEQTAILGADLVGCTFWDHNGHHHIYIDLHPCDSCDDWLEDRPENWFVHYYADIEDQAEVIRKKKDLRRGQFGRIQERRY